MFSGVALLFFLKRRHVGIALSRLVFFATGSDSRSEKSTSDVLYRVYALVFVLLCMAALWFAAIDFVETLFAGFSQSFALSLSPTLIVIPCLYFLMLIIGNLAEPPFRFSNADISYVVAGPLSATAVALSQMVGSLFASGVFGFVVGYLLGAGFTQVASTPVSPFAISFFMMAAFLLASMCGWFVSILRWSGNASRNRVPKNISIALCSTLSTLVILVVMFALMAIEGVLQFALGELPFFLGGGMLGITLLICAIALIISRRLDFPAIADANGIYAELYSLREMPLRDAMGYRELKQRRKVARRGAKIILPLGSGWRAPLTRSILSHLRQPSNLLSVIFWGALAAPLGTYLLLGYGHVQLWMMWALILLTYINGVREITRAFRDDTRNQVYRSQIPFRDLKLFMLDSAPGFSLALIVSLIITVLLLPQEVAPAVLLCVILNVIFVLSAGFENAGMTFTKYKANYEALILIFVVLVFIAAQFGDWIAIGASVVFATVLVVLFHLVDA